MTTWILNMELEHLFTGDVALPCLENSGTLAVMDHSNVRLVK